MVPLFKSVLNQVSIDNVNRVLHSGWLGQGKEVEALENEFAKYIGCKYAVALNSGTAALHLAVKCLDLPTDSMVITTPNTFVSTNHVLLYEKFIPIFADIDVDTGNISLGSVAKILANNSLSHRVSAIMLVHYGGNPVDNIDSFRSLSKDISIIEDCAHACGATHSWGVKVGSDSEVGCFSFHAVKNLPVGDGGMLTTNSSHIYERAKSLRWLGIDKSTSERASESSYRWEYNCSEVGYKYNMDDIHAAIARGQLLSLDSDNHYRRMNALYYDIALKNEDISPLDFRLLKTNPTGKSSCHMIVGLAANYHVRDCIVNEFKANKILYGMHYKPNYIYPMYTRFHRENGCPGMEEFYSKAITLPNHLELKSEDITMIAKCIKKGIANA